MNPPSAPDLTRLTEEEDRPLLPLFLEPEWYNRGMSKLHIKVYLLGGIALPERVDTGPLVLSASTLLATDGLSLITAS